MLTQLQQSIIYNIQIMIIFVFFLIIVSSKNSDIILNLSSRDRSKIITILQPCSCQLSVFPVYDYQYSVNIQLKTASDVKYVQISIPYQNICQTIQINTNRQANYQVSNVNFGQQTQLTENIYIRLLNQSQACVGEQGEVRSVYLVDKNQQSQFNYGIYMPKDTVALTQFFAFLALVILCCNIKYRRISPIRFGYIFALLYPVFLSATVYIGIYFESTINYTYYGIMAFSLILICLYFSDVLSYCSDKPVIIYTTSIAAGSILIILDMLIFTDAWFINDLIAILVAGTLIKFVVIKKMRTSIIPLTLLWVFFILRQFAIDLKLQNFEQALQIRIIPLFLQLPTLFSDSHKGYPCSAFDTSKIVIMGLILNYAIRIDLFLSGHFYKLVTSTTALLCMTLEYIIAVLIQQLPVIEYIGIIIFIPVATIIMLLTASKRGQWAQIWHGSFHDIAVDRKSVRKATSEFNEEEIDRALQQLKMDPSLLSDN